MKHLGYEFIAGDKTRADWIAVRDALVVGDSAGWHGVMHDYFSARLDLRYLNPIRILQENGTLVGEGFSIATIQCSLIEFLEATAQGKSYKYVKAGEVE